MSQPFTVELYFHSGRVVNMPLTEDVIRERGKYPGPVMSARQGPGDERTRLRTAAYVLVRRMLDPKTDVDPDFGGRAIVTGDGDGLWVIPLSSIAAAPRRPGSPRQRPDHGLRDAVGRVARRTPLGSPGGDSGSTATRGSGRPG